MMIIMNILVKGNRYEIHIHPENGILKASSPKFPLLHEEAATEDDIIKKMKKSIAECLSIQAEKGIVQIDSEELDLKFETEEMKEE